MSRRTPLLLPVWAASEGTHALGPVTWLGVSVCLASVALCEAADRQLASYDTAGALKACLTAGVAVPGTMSSIQGAR